MVWYGILKLDLMKPKPLSGRLYAIQPGNGSGLFYRCQGPHSVMCMGKRIEYKQHNHSSYNKH